MIPGFIEGHAIYWNCYNQKNIDLLNTTSFDEIIQIVKEKSQTIPEGEWIIEEAGIKINGKILLRNYLEDSLFIINCQMQCQIILST